MSPRFANSPFVFAEWSDERVAALKEMWAAGYSARQIAERLGGVTRSAVIGKANRLGLSKPTKSGVTRVAKRIEREAAAVVNIGPGVALAELRRSHCRWPLWGDAERPTGQFCGAAREGNGPYCPGHAAIACKGEKQRAVGDFKVNGPTGQTRVMPAGW